MLMFDLYLSLFNEGFSMFCSKVNILHTLNDLKFLCNVPINNQTK